MCFRPTPCPWRRSRRAVTRWPLTRRPTWVRPGFTCDGLHVVGHAPRVVGFVLIVQLAHHVAAELVDRAHRVHAGADDFPALQGPGDFVHHAQIGAHLRHDVGRCTFTTTLRRCARRRDAPAPWRPPPAALGQIPGRLLPAQLQLARNHFHHLRYGNGRTVLCSLPFLGVAGGQQFRPAGRHLPDLT